MQYVFFHGSFSSPDYGWFPIVSRALTNLNQSVLMPTFPTDDWDTIIKADENSFISKQNLNIWADTFQKTVLPKLEPSPPCFVGHSLGSLFILHLVDQFNLQLDSAVFVASFLRSPNLKQYKQVKSANQSFYKTDFNFDKLRKLIPVSYTLYSDNDPYIPNKFTLEFCQKLGSLPIMVKGGEHLGKNSGWSDFKLVTELCKTRIDAKLYK